MSELINNRQQKLKELILSLHAGKRYRNRPRRSLNFILVQLRQKKYLN